MWIDPYTKRKQHDWEKNNKIHWVLCFNFIFNSYWYIYLQEVSTGPFTPSESEHESEKDQRTRLHSSRMRTARLLSVSPYMHCAGGGLLRGVPASGHGGYPSMQWGRPPCEQNSWHTLLKILPCPHFVAGGNKRKRSPPPKNSNINEIFRFRFDIRSDWMGPYGDDSHALFPDVNKLL